MSLKTGDRPVLFLFDPHYDINRFHFVRGTMLLVARYGGAMNRLEIVCVVRHGDEIVAVRTPTGKSGEREERTIAMVLADMGDGHVYYTRGPDGTQYLVEAYTPPRPRAKRTIRSVEGTPADWTLEAIDSCPKGRKKQ